MIKINIHNNMCDDALDTNEKNFCLFSAESFLVWANNAELEGSIIFSMIILTNNLEKIMTC